MFVFEHRLLSTAFSNGFYLVNKAIKICCGQLRQLCSTSLAASSQPLPSSGHLDALKGLQIHLLFLETGHVIDCVYSYFRMSWNIEAFSLCVLLLPNLRVVPHGTKGTGPKFVTRPVYLRSQFRNDTNTVLI